MRLNNRVARLERVVDDATPPEPMAYAVQTLEGHVHMHGAVYPTVNAAKAATPLEIVLAVEVDCSRPQVTP